MRNRLLPTILAATLAIGVTMTVTVVGGQSAGATTRTEAVSAAAAYGKAHGYSIGIAVLDTQTGRYYHGGAAQSAFASESVVKTMIATRLLLQGRMHGTTAQRAYKMITQSDDTIASSFYGSVGGDSLINWIKTHYRIPELGSPPRRAGWWGNTHITAKGLVWFYEKIEKDPKVGPWLLNAMHHATKYGSDGTYQFFGLPSATSGAAIKQGWGTDFDDWGKSADFNTTGFVDGNRFAVAILSRGPVRTYGSAIGGMLTHVAKLVLPGGHLPDPAPTVTSLSATSGTTAGGQRITVHGTSFTHVSAVLFGSTKGTAVKVLSSTSVQVTTPAHAAGMLHVRVATTHGTTSAETGQFQYVAPPALTSVAPSTGGTSGGTKVTIHGTNFTRVTRVSFGSAAGTSVQVSSSTALTAVAPAHAAGRVDVRVTGAYGTSGIVTKDGFTYVAAPAVTGVAPDSGPSAGGNQVTITGTALGSVTGVDFDTTPAAVVSKTSTAITVVAPQHSAGVVPVRLHSPYARSSVVSAGSYAYGS